jgi:hypothetical protein
MQNGTRVVTREMADYYAIRTHFDGRNLNYYTFHPKSEKPIKAVIRHLPTDTPAEDISNGLTKFGFTVLSVWQMTANRRSPEGETQNLPLFLVTLHKHAKSPEIFKLTSLCHLSFHFMIDDILNNVTVETKQKRAIKYASLICDNIQKLNVITMINKLGTFYIFMPNGH